MTGIGHNGGPTMEPGHGWRRHAWGRARKALMPNTVPLEIVRLRVKRAQALGLDYRTYASIRAASGHDVVAFLFSGNALELTPRRVTVPAAVVARLTELDGAADRLAAVYAPVAPEAVTAANPDLFEHVGPAPGFTGTWRQMRERIGAALRARSLAPDGVVLVSATGVEREWCAAGKLAGIVPAERFFGAEAAPV
ncbi:hypothetical protein P1J78_20230 [Psychromarinibacter sp. C21-152]|uniref:Uncharacterized protein n=1 Tax=Psychromarinibacter sediminicola TaxID=3033385 RepID=A0AAE3T9X0_9RHOB|nr:hypothetical protein [Psychromarinibacter sediminicola]MDF0603080.1 hypothetical protein [Psychromarinibacter sediminicola]